MAYKKYTVDNTAVKEELNQYWMWEDLPSDYNDLISGAVGQCNGKTRINPAFIFRLLQTISHINVETVDSAINRKRVALGEEPVGLRMVQHYTSILRCASQAVEHDLWKQANQIGQ